MTEPVRPMFAAFGSSYDDNAFGEDVPIGSVLRLDAAAFERLQRGARQVLSGDLGDVEVLLDGDAFRWIKKIGFTAENSVAPIPGFMAAEDILVAQEAFLEAEMDVLADYQDECDIYPHQMNAVGLKFMLHGELLVCPVGWVQLGEQRFNYGGLYEPWAKIEAWARALFGESAADTAVTEKSSALVMDATDKATVLAALSVYLRDGQGDPDRRSDEIQELATAGDEVISMDDEGVKGLIERVRRVQPQQARVEDELADEPRAYFESVLQIKVLSEESSAEGMGLQQLVDAITTGDCVGEVAFLGARQISAQTAARRLSEMGSEPGFFRLSEDGVHEDDEDVLSADRPSI